MHRINPTRKKEDSMQAIKAVQMHRMHEISVSDAPPFVKVPVEVLRLNRRALRSYLAIRYYAFGKAKVSGVEQAEFVTRSQTSETTFRRGLRDCEEAGLISTVRVQSSSGARHRYSFSPSQRFARVPVDSVDAVLSLRDGEMAIYAHLCLYSDTDWRTWVGNKTLAEAANTSDKVVRRALGLMVSAGIIQKDGRFLVTHPRMFASDEAGLPVTQVPPSGTPVTGSTPESAGTPVTGSIRNTRPLVVENVKDQDHAPLPRRTDWMAMDGDDLPPVGGDLFGPVKKFGKKSGFSAVDMYEDMLFKVAPKIEVSVKDRMIIGRRFNDLRALGWSKEDLIKGIELFGAQGVDRLMASEPHWKIFFRFLKEKQGFITMGDSSKPSAEVVEFPVRPSNADERARFREELKERREKARIEARRRGR
jgi:Helix-turn-helix domain